MLEVYINTNNLVTISARNIMSITAPPLYQWDYGQKLKLTGPNLPPITEVHFCNKKSKEAIVRLGGDGLEVPIPDELLKERYEIHAFLYFEDQTNGKTAGHVIIPIIARPEPEDFMETVTPTEEQILQSAIRELQKHVSGELTEKVDKAVQNSEAVLDDATQFYQDGITEEELKAYIDGKISGAITPVKEVTVEFEEDGDYLVGSFTDDNITENVLVEVFIPGYKGFLYYLEEASLTGTTVTIKLQADAGITSANLFYIISALNELESRVYLHA